MDFLEDTSVNPAHLARARRRAADDRKGYLNSRGHSRRLCTPVRRRAETSSYPAARYRFIRHTCKRPRRATNLPSAVAGPRLTTRRSPTRPDVIKRVASADHQPCFARTPKRNMRFVSVAGRRFNFLCSNDAAYHAADPVCSRDFTFARARNLRPTYILDRQRVAIPRFAAGESDRALRRPQLGPTTRPILRGLGEFA